MKILVNRSVRRLFVATGMFLLAAVLAGLALVWLAVNDYKNALVARDAALAGALLQQGLDPVSVAAVFTAEKTEAMRAAGRLALEQAGVTEDTSYRLVPEAEAFLRRYSATVLAAGALFAAVALAGLYHFFTRQERQVERVSQAIEQFMQAGGQGNNRLPASRLAGGSLEEGSLGQLFTTVNRMASSLTAHLQKEQRDREFLKDTISDISHQLKTPLAALRMYTEIIRDENPSNPVIADFISRSESELARMEYLIQNLLTLARLDAGAIVLEKRPLSLPRFLEEVLEGFAVRARTEAKQIRLCCPAGLVLDGDEHWLAEAVSNLVKNALDHTGAGGLIEVEGEETALFITITVRDNGAGIHPDDLPYVFKRFYRSRFSQDRQGVGIGLTLARSIVEKHGGSMVVESEMGRGAAFQMIFPKLTNL